MAASGSGLRLLVAIALLLHPAVCWAQRSDRPPIPIWPAGAPDSDPAHWPRPDYHETWDTAGRNVAGVTEPTIQVFLPEPGKNTGAAVVVCPGGGYNTVVMEKEGWRVARELNRRGIAAMVLKYRLYDRMAAVQDAQRAVRYVRAHAAEWRINPRAVGIGGFSAGGHLSLNMAARLAQTPSPVHDAVDSFPGRPDFVLAVYPSVYLGDGAVVDSTYPPTFIVSAADDPKMKPADILAFFARLQELHVPSELHIYQSGGHGFGVGTPACNCSSWLDLFRAWLESSGRIPRGAVASPTAEPVRSREAPGSGSTKAAPRMDRFVDSLAAAVLRAEKTAGLTVAVVRARDTLAMKGYGRIDWDARIPTPPGAVYEIGSVTKQFTAAAILQLAEQGRLNLDDDIRKYLLRYPTHGQRITLRQLLSHTSGIPSYTSMPGFERLASRAMPRDSLLALMGAAPLDFAPGERMSYSNSGYFLLGLVIERVSGMPYAQYVRKHLFERAGMRRTRYCEDGEPVPPRAKGYEPWVVGVRRVAANEMTWPYAAGALCSTAGDLIAWNRALHGGRILGTEVYREMIAPGSLEDGTRLRYAKGLRVDSLVGRRAFHHGGAIPGFLSVLQYYPDDSVSIVVLVNTIGGASPERIADRIGERLFGRLQRRTAQYPGDAKLLAGTYRGTGARGPFTARVAVTPTGTLTVAFDRSPAAPLGWIGGRTFEAPGARLIFAPGTDAPAYFTFDGVISVGRMSRVNPRTRRSARSLPPIRLSASRRAEPGP